MFHSEYRFFLVKDEIFVSPLIDVIFAYSGLFIGVFFTNKQLVILALLPTLYSHIDLFAVFFSLFAYTDVSKYEIRRKWVNRGLHCKVGNIGILEGL